MSVQAVCGSPKFYLKLLDFVIVLIFKGIRHFVQFEWYIRIKRDELFFIYLAYLILSDLSSYELKRIKVSFFGRLDVMLCQLLHQTICI